MIVSGLRSVKKPVNFPLVASGNGRYLVDQDGVPFPMLGRNAWSLTEVSTNNYKTFLNNTVNTHGFTTIEVWIPGRYTGTVGDPGGASVNPAKDGANNPAFSKRLDGNNWDGTLAYSNINNEAPDFTQPNASYWASIDAFFDYCNRLGILVMFFPCYVGYPSTTEGWMNEMVANGATKCQTYGAWVATRYISQPNLIWMIGGDRGTGDGTFTAGEATVHTAFVTGLTSVAGQASTLYSAEWKRSNGGLSGSIATDLFDGAPINLNGTYANETQINNQAERAYAHNPAYPAFLLESPFSHHPSTTEPSRRFAWWGMLSNIGGYTLGDYDIYRFVSGWDTAINNTVAQHHAVLNAFVRSVAWYALAPAQSMITAGGGTADAADEVRAAKNTGSTLAVLYIPPAHTGSVTVDKSVMSGSFRARWFDPSNGAYTAIGTGIANTGTQAYTPSGNNAGGDGDWVLVLDI